MASILITGAGRGIGRSLVEVFAERGDSVFALARKPLSDGDAMAGVVPILADVSDDACKQVIVRTLEANRVQSLDVLVNNAGIGGSGRSLAAIDSSEMLALFQINCLGALRCTQACLPYLRAASHPIVVNISSRLGSLAWNDENGATAQNHSYSYRVSKAALNMLTICMGVEMESLGLKVFAIHPGTVRTALGSPDADLSPREAAEELARLISSTNLDSPRFCGPGAVPFPW